MVRVRRFYTHFILYSSLFHTGLLLIISPYLLSLTPLFKFAIHWYCSTHGKGFGSHFCTTKFDGAGVKKQGGNLHEHPRRYFHLNNIHLRS